MILHLLFALISICMGLPVSAQQIGHGEAHLGASVMPFDVGRSRHVFAPDASGGTQSVISRDGDPAQVTLIRGHLRHEAAAFARGNFADPAAIHGATMPGLKELQAAADRIAVAFVEVPGGASIRFVSRDPKLIDALHRWFAAQLHDHGADATSGM